MKTATIRFLAHGAVSDQGSSSERALTSEGVAQVEAVRTHWVDGEEFIPRIVFTSIAWCAIQTAQVLLGSQRTITIASPELYQGHATAPQTQIQVVLESRAVPLSEHFRQGRQDALRQYAQRAVDRIRCETFLRHTPPEQKVLVIGHDGLLQAIAWGLMGFTDAMSLQPPLSPCDWTEVMLRALPRAA